jgi:hypothetical protein
MPAGRLFSVCQLDAEGFVISRASQRSASNRGIRFRRMSHGLNAVRSNAGLMLCGLALLSNLIDER